VKLPLTQLLFNGVPVTSGRGQTGRQAGGAPPHLFRFGEPLLDQPPAVAGLEWLRQPTQVPEGERGNPGPDGQRTRSVGTSQLEGAQPLEGATEGRVLAHALAQSETSGRLGQVDVEPVPLHLEAVGEPAQ
jgi:hypothetical protein